MSDCHRISLAVATAMARSPAASEPSSYSLTTSVIANPSVPMAATLGRADGCLNALEVTGGDMKMTSCMPDVSGRQFRRRVSDNSASMATGASVLRFESFELDVRSRELTRGTRRVRLQEQPFEILRLMLERPGDVVTREELAQRLWPTGTFVDFEHSQRRGEAPARRAWRRCR